MQTENEGQATATEAPATTETVEAPTAEATPAAPAVEVSAEGKVIVEWLDNEIAKIKALPKKSNYHNARASAYKQVRELISPTPPAPPKEKKSKAKSAKAVAAEGGDTSTAPAPTAPAAQTDADTTQYVPVEEGA